MKLKFILKESFKICLFFMKYIMIKYHFYLYFNINEKILNFSGLNIK